MCSVNSSCTDLLSLVQQWTLFLPDCVGYQLQNIHDSQLPKQDLCYSFSFLKTFSCPFDTISLKQTNKQLLWSLTMTSAVFLVIFFPFVFPCSGRTAQEICMEISGGSRNSLPRLQTFLIKYLSQNTTGIMVKNYFEQQKIPSSLAQTQILKRLLCEQWMWTMNQNILLVKWLLYHHIFEDSQYFSVICNVLHDAMPGNCSAKSS